MTDPILALAVDDGHGTSFRVLLVDSVDSNGVVQTVPWVEKTYVTDQDKLGVQRWTQLTGKSTHSEWVMFANALLMHALAEREQASAKNQ